jgi:Zn finger protein HypA/HybF involved in hydrogenase expression
MNHKITFEVGSMSDVRLTQFGQAMAMLGKEVVVKGCGLVVRTPRQPRDYPCDTDLSVSPSPVVFAPGEIGGRGD